MEKTYHNCFKTNLYYCNFNHIFILLIVFSTVIKQTCQLNNNQFLVKNHQEISQSQFNYSTNNSKNNQNYGENDTKISVFKQNFEKKKNPIVQAHFFGLRVEESARDLQFNNGISHIMSNSKVTVRFFGNNFTEKTMVKFVNEPGYFGKDCDDHTSTRAFFLKVDDDHSATGIIELPPFQSDFEFYYLCTKENDTNNGDTSWVHQGTDPWVTMTSYESMLPLWAKGIFITVLLTLSGLFSGLNLGLMAMDQTELKIIGSTGSNKEKRYAKSIQPLRNHGNYLLCSLLLGNVLVNSTLTILIDDLSSGIIAIVGSTMAIVIFGEIIPQAVCSRHGLAVGANTVWVTKFFMALTFPISYPISVILDKILGEEIGNVYNRDRLKELLRVTKDFNDLENEEVNIISGALDMKVKTVSDIMTKLEEVYMLASDAVLDFDTISEIVDQGYSRIPVYEGNRSNIVSLLYTKDLAFVDPDDKMPLKTICEFYNNSCNYVFDNTTLDVIFKEFKQGDKGHLAFVQKIKHAGEKDPFYETVGVVTLEDVIETLIQAEINDETDVWESKNNHNRRRSRAILLFPELSGEAAKTTDGLKISQQMVLAAFQYLSTSVPQFNHSLISKIILQRLLRQNLFIQIKLKNRDSYPQAYDPNAIIYERGKAADYFVLILEGRVQVEVGCENLVFESGPFTFFGTQCLLFSNDTIRSTELRKQSLKLSSGPNSERFIPDYTVRAIADSLYLQIPRSIYLAAMQATLLEKSYQYSGDGGDVDTDKQFKVFNDFDEKMTKMIGNGKNYSHSTVYINPKTEVNLRKASKDNVQNQNDNLSEIILSPSQLLNNLNDDLKKTNLINNNVVNNDPVIDDKLENNINLSSRTSNQSDVEDISISNSKPQEELDEQKIEDALKNTK